MLFSVSLILANLNSVLSIAISEVWSVEKFFEKKGETWEVKPTNSLPIYSKELFGALEWSYPLRNVYMAHCTSDEDCKTGFHLICKSGRCTCKTGDIFFEWPKSGCFSKAQMFGQCEVSGQCMAMNANTYCNPESGRCTCSPNYFYDGRQCIVRYDSANIKAQEVYKAAVVAAACFIVAVVGIFVACIVRRSFCRREQHLQQSESNRSGDIFSVSDELAALRAVDKPPSYEEVLQIERTFYGIPPPEYTAPRSESSSSALYLPTSCASAQTEYLNQPYNPEFSSVPESDSSNHAATSEDCFKNSAQESTSLCDNSSYNSVFQNAQGANFLASAEVLPVPSDVQDIDDFTLCSFLPSLEASSHTIQSCYVSSTPPPRLHREIPKPIYNTSSLPGSPYLNSRSSNDNSVVLDPLALPLRKKLLKQSPQFSLPNSPFHHIQDSSSSSHTTSLCNISVAEETSTQVVDNSNHDNSLTTSAYDNLGFVSDLQA